MNFGQELKNSKLAEAGHFLFGDTWALPLKETIFYRFFPKYSHHSAAFIFAILSILALWYQGWFAANIPFLAHDFLPPFLLLVSFLLTPKENFVLKKYHLWFLGFLISLLAAGFFGVLKFGARLEVVLGWFVFLQFGVALLVGGGLGTKKPFYAATILGALPIVIFGVVQAALGEGFGYSYLETAGNRVTSFLGNPNIFGFVLVILILLSVDLYFRSQNRGQRLTMVFLALAMFILLYYTGSRTAWLALFFGATTLVLVKNPRWLLFSPLILLAFWVPRFRERFLLVFKSEYYLDSSIDGRVWALNNSINIWQKNIFGTGPGTYGGKFARDYSSSVYLDGMQRGYPALLTTDNQYLSVLVQGGVFGTLSFVGLFISLLFTLVRRKSFLGLGLLVSLFVMMGFSNALEFGAVAVPVGILLGAEAVTINKND